MPPRVRSDLKLLSWMQAVAVQLPCQCWSRVDKLTGVPTPLSSTQGVTPWSFKPEKQGWGEKLSCFTAIIIGHNCVNVLSCCLHGYVYGWLWTTPKKAWDFPGETQVGTRTSPEAAGWVPHQQSPLYMGEKPSRGKGSPCAQDTCCPILSQPLICRAGASWGTWRVCFLRWIARE